MDQMRCATHLDDPIEKNAGIGNAVVCKAGRLGTVGGSTVCLSTFDGFPPSSCGFELNFRRFFTPGFIWGLSENSVPLHPMVNDHYPY